MTWFGGAMLLVLLVGGASRAEAATFSRMTLRTDTLLANLDGSDFTGRCQQHVPRVMASKSALRRTNSGTATFGGLVNNQHFEQFHSWPAVSEP